MRFSFRPVNGVRARLRPSDAVASRSSSGVAYHQSLPLEGLDIRGFRGLLQLFHFEAVLQSALALGTGEGYIIDAMQMRHVVDGREITLYKQGEAGWR